MASLDVCCVLCEVKVMNCITWNTSEKTPKDLACVTSFNILWFRKCPSDLTSWLLLFKNQSLLVSPFQSIIYHSHRISHDSDSLSPASRYFITVTAHHAHRKSDIAVLRQVLYVFIQSASLLYGQIPPAKNTPVFNLFMFPADYEGKTKKHMLFIKHVWPDMPVIK